MAGITNRGKYNMLNRAFRDGSTYNMALLTNDTPPTADSNTLADVSEIAAGTGYTSGGASLTGNATDFDVLTEDDVNDRALIQVKDVVFTASGGNIPTSGNGARWCALTGDNVTVSARELEAYGDLSSDRTVSDGQSLTIQDFEIRLSET